MPPARSASPPARIPRPRSGEEPRLLALELLSNVAVRIASTFDLAGTLQAIAAAVVESLGFQAAVLNLVAGDDVEVAAIAGPDAVKTALEGTSEPLDVWLGLLERSQPRGGLRFIDGRAGERLEGFNTWVPDIPIDDDPDQWHPHDALFAPLRGAGDALIGVLSVDLPVDGRRPNCSRVGLLERFAAMAALAIERARMHQRVVDSAELFRRTFEDAPLAMALLRLDGTVEEANHAYARQFGAKERVGRPCWEYVRRRDQEALRTLVAKVASGVLAVGEGEAGSRSGRQRGQYTVSRLNGPNGPQLLFQLLDVTAQHKATAALKQQAETDSLTGLLNRTGLARHLDRLLDSSTGRSGDGVAVVFCDIDLFKLVNDTYGHAAGDQLLAHIGASLRRELRRGDTAARFGGDEFVVVLRGCDNAAAAIAAAERIRAAICRAVPLAAGTMVPSVSMGIALAEPGVSGEQLLADADTALYRAKDGGRGRWELFAPDMRDQAVARLRVRQELRDALVADQLVLHYQPVVELGSDRVAGYEALLRWQHPQLGLLPPAAFLDELMVGELADPTTDWVIDRAIGDAVSWSAAPGFVSVNVSPGQLTRAELPEVVSSALARHQLPPERLWIEVTEEGVLTEAAQLSVLESLRGLRVHVVIDDFGSGYAGLFALRHVPADIVKLDREFTRSLEHDHETRVIVESVVSLCTSLGRGLVAEGLETLDDVTVMRDMGVLFGQGWQLGRPGPLATQAKPLTGRGR